MATTPLEELLAKEADGTIEPGELLRLQKLKDWEAGQPDRLKALLGTVSSNALRRPEPPQNLHESSRTTIVKPGGFFGMFKRMDEQVKDRTEQLELNTPDEKKEGQGPPLVE